MCNSKAFVDIATAGRHCGLSTIYIKTTCSIEAILGDTLSFKTQCSPQVFPWFAAIQCPWCKNRARIKASWLKLRSNICSLRSFIDWNIAKMRQSITLLYKHWIHSLIISYPWPVETTKVFEGETHKISLISKCSSWFPENAKVFSFSLLPKRSFQVSLWKPSQSAQKRLKAWKNNTWRNLKMEFS